MDANRGLGDRAPYWLAPHVHLSLCDGHVVLMDVRHNRYVAVQPAEGLADWVGGWPVLAGGHRERPPTVLVRLLEQGLLVADRSAGHPATPQQNEAPARTLLEFDFDERPAPDGRDLVRMARAWLWARAMLTFRPMHAVIESVRSRGTDHAAPESPLDWERARSLVRVFVHLRPLFYSARGACLLDSLAMLRFLRAYELHPRWVFGVRTAPFHAHCWLQHGPVLFNDLPDRVRQYAPILRV